MYFGVVTPTFAYGDHGLIHADHWLQTGPSKWPSGAAKAPQLGVLGFPPLTTLGDSRGQVLTMPQTDSRW